MIEILLKTSFFSSLLSHLIGKPKGKREAKTTLKLLFKYFDKISKWSFNLLDLTLNSPNFQFCHLNPLIMTNTYILYACMYLCMNACMNSYVFRMGYYRQVKTEHQKPAGLLQPLEVIEWKWEHVTMDFVTHLPRTPQRHDVVWVIVDRLTKSAHFLAVRMTFTLERFYRLYIREIVRLHGVPVSIVLDRDPRFTTHFWKSFQKAMGTRLTMSTAFHPQIDGQSEKTIQVLEDMLRACDLDRKGSWEEHLPSVEFAYNNSYQASIQMAPYEALYGRPCRSPLCWAEVGESSINGPDLIRDTSEKVSLIRQFLLTAQSR